MPPDREIPVRVTVVGMAPSVTCAMQRGKCELLPPTRVSAESRAFDFKVRVAERKGGGSPNILGPYAHGKPDDRFLYLNSGAAAGQPGTTWQRRAKIKTGGISWKLVDAVLARPGSLLEVRIAGTAKDGGPCCATVPLLAGGWTLIGP